MCRVPKSVRAEVGRTCTGGEHWIGLDLGGTTVSAVLVDGDGTVLASASEKIPPADKSPTGVAQHMAAAARAVLSSGQVGIDAVTGIGIGSPGNLDYAAGMVRNAANFPTWHDVPLCELVAAELAAPCLVVLENDANAALLAEVWTGAAKGRQNVVMVTLGTGIGGGAVVDGQLLRGANGMATEIGHMIVCKDGRLNSSTGVRGVSEEYGSAGGIARWAREAADGHPFRSPPVCRCLSRP